MRPQACRGQPDTQNFGGIVKNKTGTSLAVQWLGLSASAAGARVLSLVRELRSRKPHGATQSKTKQNRAFSYLLQVVSGWFEI